MSGERDALTWLNRWFGDLGDWSYRRRWWVAALSVCVIAASGWLASGVRFDNGFEAYFDLQDPTYAAYLDYRRDFGSDEISYVLYEAPDAEHGPWNLQVMRQIAALTDALEEEVPFVREVTSLVNVEFMDPVDDGIEIFDLLHDFPDDQDALLRIRDKVLQKPLYVGGLASADGKSAAIILEMSKSSIDPLDEIRVDPAEGNALSNLYPQATSEKIEEILARPAYEGIVFHHTGDAPLNAAVNTISERESASLGGITLLVIGALLWFFFRGVVGVVGPLAVVAISILVSAAAVGAAGWDLDFIFSMLPTLMIAVGVADSVHLLTEYRTYRAATGDPREAARRTLFLVGPPCLLTSLTTAAGFAAMTIAPIKAIAHFAFYSAVGVMAAFFFSVTLLMVFLSFEKGAAGTPGSGASQRGGRLLTRLLRAVTRFDLEHSGAIVVVAAVFVGLCGLGIAALRVDSNFLSDFSEEVEVRRATEYVERVMSGSTSLVYLFDSGVEDGIKAPAFLREVERLQAAADDHGELVRKTYSVVDLLKDVNQTFHEGDPTYFRIPETRELVAQYLLLYELSGGEEIGDYVSLDYARTALELRCRTTDSSQLAELATELDEVLGAASPHGVTVMTTGVGALWLRLMDYITESQIRGFLLAFAAITVMMCLLFRSIPVGLLAMVPNLVPVIVTLGIMGWLGIALDYNRLFIAPVAIGIAVDDTIHLITRLRLEFSRHGSYAEALRVSMLEVGRALYVTSVVLIAGFLVFLFSVMDSMASFGVLLSSTIVLALVANFFLLPALVLLCKPFGPEGRVSV